MLTFTFSMDSLSLHESTFLFRSQITDMASYCSHWGPMSESYLIPDNISSFLGQNRKDAWIPEPGTYKSFNYRSLRTEKPPKCFSECL